MSAVAPQARRPRTRTPAEARFWPKVDRSGGLWACWEWTGAIQNGRYGSFGLGTRTMPRVLAHRFAYESIVGPIPEGLTLDHLCRNTRCVNPAHLEPVTNAVNSMRGTGVGAQHAAATHCPQGHPYDAANTIVGRKGWRSCRQCKRASDRRYRLAAGSPR